MISFFKKYGLLTLGLFMLSILLFIAFAGPYLPGIDRVLEPVDFLWNDEGVPMIPPFEPSELFKLGSDNLGRDLLSMIVVGTKETLFIILSITFIRYLFALPIGYLAHKKIVGFNFLLNWLNTLLSYIPTIIIVYILASLPPIEYADSRPIYLVLIIALAEMGRVASVFKSDFEELSNKEFVNGGIAVGVSPIRMLRRYVLPFIYQIIIVNFVTDIGKVMFLLGQLAFIDIFLAQEIVRVESYFANQNISYAWPMLLVDANQEIRRSLWIPMYPVIAMTYLIFTFNILAQGLQKYFQKTNQYV